MKLLVSLAVLTALVALYVVWLRPWLRTKSWANGFFAWIEPAELLLFKKSESILWARFLQTVGLGIPVLQAIGAFDITPYLAIIPEGWGPYLLLLIFVAGQVGELLRKRTTKPLEVVALPEAVAAKPEVAEALAIAEVAKTDAVAVAKDAV